MIDNKKSQRQASALPASDSQLAYLSLFTALLIASTFIAPNAWPGVALDDDGKVNLYADFRLRLESDWDSVQSDGQDREDRARMRVRARVGLDLKATENIEMGVRLRSGSDDSQQSPHITVVDFDDNDTGDADFNLDRWFARAHYGDFSAWAGRDSPPLWKQNELLWSDDVTVAGLGGKYEHGALGLNLGYFSLPAGMQGFSGEMGLAQLVFNFTVGDAASITLAAGFMSLDADEDDSDGELLLDGNNARDHSQWVGNFQYKTDMASRPFLLGLDLLHNAEDYDTDDPDDFTRFHRDETDGYVFQVKYGSSSKPREWLVGYYYAHIESLAVNNSYAQDNWLRWGNATQTRGSNFEGHEFLFEYGMVENLKLVARLYLVEAIKVRAADSATKEDGNRFRIDFNYSF